MYLIPFPSSTTALAAAFVALPDSADFSTKPAQPLPINLSAEEIRAMVRDILG